MIGQSEDVVDQGIVAESIFASGKAREFASSEK